MRRGASAGGTMSIRLPVAADALVAAPPATSQNLPPASGLLLSQIVAGVEQSQPVRVFTEIERDGDGYRHIETINPNNRRSSIRIDPFTDETWSRLRR
jgi:hypothetical protein